MKLSIGIVGLPNVGKSTLFKMLTKQNITIANYPFATIDPNVGVVAVPDLRLQKLAKMSSSKKVIPAVVEFYDIAGLVKGANQGEGLGNQFLSHIRDVSAIVQVVRCFPADEIVHIEEGVDPIRDIEIINTELMLKDLETIEKRLGKLEGDLPAMLRNARQAGARTGNKQKIKDLEIVKNTRELLNTSTSINGSGLEDEPIMREMSLLSAKPQLYLLNGKEADVSDALKNKIKEPGGEYIVADLAAEADISFLIQKAYEILGLISFLTTGEDETRAWTIYRDTKAPQAAGVIHTDFEKKFIRAEVINWEKLLEAGSWQNAKQKGWLRLEGKEYEIQDGDVLEIRHAP